MTLTETLKERYEFYSTTHDIYYPLYLKACEDYAEVFHNWAMSEGEDEELANLCNALYQKRELYDNLCDTLGDAMDEIASLINKDQTISDLLEEIANKCEPTPKCPNCGSTAQVKKLVPFTDTNGQYIYFDYVCGCGCHFDKDEIA
jgi:hypothetical protein